RRVVGAREEPREVIRALVGLPDFAQEPVVEVRDVRGVADRRYEEEPQDARDGSGLLHSCSWSRAQAVFFNGALARGRPVARASAPTPPGRRSRGRTLAAPTARAGDRRAATAARRPSPARGPRPGSPRTRPRRTGSCCDRDERTSAPRTD